MSDFVTVNPDDYTVEQLLAAARGETRDLKPQLAVTLLHGKLGEGAERPLVELATDESVDPRARHAAALELAAFSGAREVLGALTRSREPLVAEAAAQALARS